MQDILTSLVLAESEPDLDAVRRPGNVSSRWFVASTNRSAAISFQAGYVGAVLTESFSPAVPILSIDNALKAGPGASALSHERDLLSSAPTLIRGATALSLILLLWKRKKESVWEKEGLVLWIS